MSDVPNPFEAPEVEEYEAHDHGFTGEPGEVNFSLALRHGWDACWSNFGLWLGVGIVGTLVGMLSVVTIIGLFLVLPVLAYGMVKFTLNTVDGHAEFSDLFSGFSDYGNNLKNMLVCGFLATLISLPVSIIQNVLTAIEPTIGLLAVLPLNFAFMWFVTVRMVCWPFFIVDQDMDVIEALKASWAITDGKNGPIMVFFIISYMVIIAGMIALFIGIIPASMITYAGFASVYRQLTGTKGPVQSTL